MHTPRTVMSHYFQGGGGGGAVEKAGRRDSDVVSRLRVPLRQGFPHPRLYACHGCMLSCNHEGGDDDETLYAQRNLVQVVKDLSR